MNIDDLVGKTVFVKQKNSNCQFIVGGELQKDREGFYVFVPNNGISSYVQFRAIDVAEIKDFTTFYHVILK